MTRSFIATQFDASDSCSAGWGLPNGAVMRSPILLSRADIARITATYLLLCSLGYWSAIAKRVS